MNPDPTSLDRLHDIIAAPATPWWPPAAGWYWVLGFALVILLALVFRAILHWQHNRYRREALAELDYQEAALAVPERRAVALAALAELLKRTALSVWPRTEVAALNGQAWFAFLDRTGGMTRFRSSGALLERAAYDPRQAQAMDDVMLRDLVALVRDWLKHHRADTTGKGTP